MRIVYSITCCRLHNSPVTELKVAAQQEINIIEDRLRTCMKTRSCSRAQSDAEQRTGALCSDHLLYCGRQTWDVRDVAWGTSTCWTKLAVRASVHVIHIGPMQAVWHPQVCC